MIPRTIHQTHKSENLPDPCIGYQNKVKELHPAWTYRFYDDNLCYFIIQNEFPELIDLYEKLPYPIMRADIFRVVIIYLYGGFYFDLDMDFHQAVDSICDNEAVFGIETILSDEQLIEHDHSHAVRIANYGFGAVSGHPYFEKMIFSWLENKDELINVVSEKGVLNSTGPGFFTSFYHTSPSHLTEGILILNPGTRHCPKCRQNRCQFGPYASHLHMSSWRWE